MKALKILTHPNPILDMPCEGITEFNQELCNLANDMMYTALKDNRGVGLAAPQIGKSIRLVVIAAPGFPKIALANPVITKAKGSAFGPEGCLSLPGVVKQVERATTVWVSYQNLNGEAQTLKAKDFLARVIQHECDHLDGIEFIQRNCK